MSRPRKPKMRNVQVPEELWAQVEELAKAAYLPPEVHFLSLLSGAIRGSAAPAISTAPKPLRDRPGVYVDPSKVEVAATHSGYKGVFAYGNGWRTTFRGGVVGTYETPLAAAQGRYLAQQAYDEELAENQRVAAEEEARREADQPLSEGVERAANTSGYRGVYPHGTRWKATYKNQLVGIFDTPLKAAEARIPFIRNGEIAAEEQAREAREERERETNAIIKQTADEIRARAASGAPQAVRGKDAPIARGPSRETPKPKVDASAAEPPKAVVKPTMVTPPRRPRLVQTPPPNGSRPAASADDGLGVIAEDETEDDEDVVAERKPEDQAS